MPHTMSVQLPALRKGFIAVCLVKTSTEELDKKTNFFLGIPFFLGKKATTERTEQFTYRQK